VKEKNFDCVKMKDEIQAKLRKEREGMTDEEIRSAIKNKLETSDIPLAQWWRNIVSRQATSK